MQVYFKAIEGQQPGPSWDDKLTRASGQFRALKDKGSTFVAGPTVGTTS